jgi:hypothetical protein
MRHIIKTSTILSNMRVLGKRKSLPSSSTICTQPPTKKRKLLTEPVLTIIIGKEELIYLYHPRKMVNHSRYIRTKVMSALMRELQDPFTLILADIASSDWDLMMKYMDFSECLSLEDAEYLLPLYHRYGFEEGVKLCMQRIGIGTVKDEASLGKRP